MTEEEINSYAGYLCLFPAIISANKHPFRNAHGTKKQKGQETVKCVDVSPAMKYRKNDTDAYLYLALKKLPNSGQLRKA